MIKTLLIFICVLRHIYTDQFALFTQKMLKIVDQFAYQTLESFSKFDDTCLIKSYDECEGTSHLTCYEDFPTKEGCAGGGVRLAQKSAIRLPKQALKEYLNNQQKHVICRTAELQSYFQSFHGERNGQFLTSFLGTSTGMYRSYPTLKYLNKTNNLGNCQEYDPRFRGWYTSSITGKKQMVLIIDNSNSMQYHIKTMIKAAQLIIKSLTADDILLAYTVGSKVNSLTENYITFMNNTEIKNLQKKLDQVENYGGSAEMVKGLETAYQTLQEAHKLEKLCCMDKQGVYNVVFIIFTDEIRESKTEEMREIIDEYNNTFKSQFFTFSFASKDDYINQNLENLACNNFGESFRILSNASNAEIRKTVQQIYVIMGKTQNFDKPRWSEMYQDAFGYGTVSSITKPIQYKFEDSSYLLGVVGIDVPAASWLKLVDSLQEAERRLQNFNQYKISPIICRKQRNQTIIPPFSNITDPIFAEIISRQTSKCCGLTTGGLIGIIVGLVSFLGIVVAIIIYCCWKKKKPKQLEEQKKKSDQERQMQLAMAQQGTNRPIIFSYPYPPPYREIQFNFPKPPPEILQ